MAFHMGAVTQTQDLILQSSHTLVPVLTLVTVYFANTYRALFSSSFLSSYYTSDLRLYIIN